MGVYKYEGRNDRKFNHNKYCKVLTDGCEVLPSGAIVVRVICQKPRKQK